MQLGSCTLCCKVRGLCSERFNDVAGCCLGYAFLGLLEFPASCEIDSVRNYYANGIYDGEMLTEIYGK